MKRYRAIADYYDAENEHLEMLQQDVPFFLKHLSARRSQSVLELACGTARAAIPIAQAGHRVTGIDYANDMLAIARRKRDAVGLTDAQLKLLPGDLLKLDLRQRFDWIAIFFNTFLGFTTLAEQDRVLRRVVRHLKPRGKFWLDIFHPDFARLAEPKSIAMETRAFYVPQLNRTVVRTVDVKRDPSRQFQEVIFRYQWFDADGREKRAKMAFGMTYIVPRELTLLMERNGLKIETLYGDYDGSALSADSPRMIAVCSVI